MTHALYRNANSGCADVCSAVARLVRRVCGNLTQFKYGDFVGRLRGASSGASKDPCRDKMMNESAEI